MPYYRHAIRSHMSDTVKRILYLNGALLLNILKVATRLLSLGLLLLLLFVGYRYSFHTLDSNVWIVGIIVFWILTAYIVLPRVHRWLTKLYLPDYYMGRARTGDGLLGDPINVAVLGSAKELRTAMLAAGWVETDRATTRNMGRMVKDTILGRSYPAAPGSNLYLFGYRQTFSFQKEANGNPRSRHHVRFWKTPNNWWLPGGFSADWLGAVHFDKRIGLSAFSGQIMHKINQNLDEQRDYLVADLRRTHKVAHVQTVAHFSSGFHARGGGGDHIQTDGDMPFIDLRQTKKR